MALIQTSYSYDRVVFFSGFFFFAWREEGNYFKQLPSSLQPKKKYLITILPSTHLPPSLTTAVPDLWQLIKTSLDLQKLLRQCFVPVANMLWRSLSLLHFYLRNVREFYRYWGPDKVVQLRSQNFSLGNERLFPDPPTFKGKVLGSTLSVECSTNPPFIGPTGKIIVFKFNYFSF